MTTQAEREALSDPSNPMGIEGVEYVEYRTAKPQALGQVLELMGFRPVARHRSREVLLYRQGPMNLIINAHAGSGGARLAEPTYRAKRDEVARAHRTP